MKTILRPNFNSLKQGLHETSLKKITQSDPLNKQKNLTTLYNKIILIIQLENFLPNYLEYCAFNYFDLSYTTTPVIFFGKFSHSTLLTTEPPILFFDKLKTRRGGGGLCITLGQGRLRLYLILGIGVRQYQVSSILSHIFHNFKRKGPTSAQLTLCKKAPFFFQSFINSKRTGKFYL